MRYLLMIVCLASSVQMEGCGGPREIPGGTPGVIRIDGKGITDVQVSAYRRTQDQSFELVGIGISRRDGAFELRKPDTLEAVWLEAGEYRFTIESIGEVNLPWRPEFRNPEKTPLRHKTTGHSQQGSLEFDVPDPTTRRR